MSQDSNNNRIYDKLDKIDDKFDRKFEKLDRRMDNTERELVIYNEQLKVHIEGVRQSKEENQMLRQYIDIETQKLRNSMAPVTDYVNEIKSTFSTIKKIAQIISYIVTASATVAGIVYTILQILGK